MLVDPSLRSDLRPPHRAGSGGSPRWRPRKGSIGIQQLFTRNLLCVSPQKARILGIPAHSRGSAA